MKHNLTFSNYQNLKRNLLKKMDFFAPPDMTAIYRLEMKSIPSVDWL